jgi:hypothetical protein
MAMWQHGNLKDKLKLFLIALALISAGVILAFCAVLPQAEHVSFQNTNNTHNTYQETVLPIEELEPSRAERVMRALAAAYPRRVLRAEYRNGDWAVLLRDTWFYYAEGRLLPEELLDRASNYSPIAFYNYQSELLPWTEPSPEQIARFRNIDSERAARPPRAHYFFDALYRAQNRNEAYNRVKTLMFLGHRVMVHYAILEDLSLVEEQILAAARTDPQVSAWINNIGSLVGWNWRNVAGTQSRSFHAYGVAIDILPRSTGGRAIYWLWAGPYWWNIPHERRYHPPDAVIKAFESYGFVWGGKWIFFDAMHFEYRPEVFILNEMELATLR